MIRPLTISVISLAMLAVLPSAAQAQTNVPTLVPMPGKPVCGNGSGQVGNVPAKFEICLQQSAGMGRDTYFFNINGKPAVQAIDDDSIKGVSGTYEKTRVMLICTPQTRPPKQISDIMVRTYQRTMKVSEDEARKMVIKQESIEVARRCSARVSDKIALEVIFKLQ